MIRKSLVFLMFLTLVGCSTTTTMFINISSTNSYTTTLTTTEPPEFEPDFDYLLFNLSGFASGYISDKTNHAKVAVSTEEDFIKALNNKDLQVIEIKNDLDLGFYYLGSLFDIKKYSFITSHNKPLLHPILLETGVSKITIQDRKSLLIYSTNGAMIKHAGFVIKRCEDIVFRNLKFSELWEFDEATKGDYDRNDWDYFTIEASNGVWLDHLEFEKAYDGLVDLKKGSQNVTISWSKFIFEPNDFIYTQFNYLEENKDEFPFYKFLRDGGMTVDEIVLLNSSQKKGHLVGSSELDESNKTLSLTLHHNIYKNLQDRLPRLRAGNVHLYNVILDNSNLLEIKETLTRKYPKIMSSSTYKTGITNQGIVTTEGGAVLMESSLFRGVSTPIKNNQKNTELQYTGKFMVLNSIYDYGNKVFIGGSNDKASLFIGKPMQALEFSWNQLEKLPYEYQMIEIHELELLLGKGYVGTLENKLNWLNTLEVIR